MSTRSTRRAVLAGLAASAALPALAAAPVATIRPVPRGEQPPPPPKPAPTPIADIIRAAGLGGTVGCLVVNAETGDFIEGHNAELRLPPASVAKAATAHYALSRLGPAHRFRTRLIGTGPIENGVLKGDLILQGGGDPNLDTDGLAGMIEMLKEKGVREVEGAFRVDASALPYIPFIDPDQPDHVGYNPAIAGVNLNFNRVHFEWKKKGSSYDVTMQARAVRYSPEVAMARMAVEDRSLPVYTYAERDGVDRWTVARRALGKGGARWLPVKRPADYVAEVFTTVARYHDLPLRRGPLAPNAKGDVLVETESAALKDMLRAMLKYSTNLTAETVGLAATRNAGVEPPNLIMSARQMNLWFNGEIGCRATGFVDHSGLGYGSRVSAEDMVKILMSARKDGLLPGLMKPFRTDVKGLNVQAKTGTLNFVSSLAGYVETKGMPPLAFAIFTADMPRRDAIPINQRERPDGARGWAGASRGLQRKLIQRWANLAA